MTATVPVEAALRALQVLFPVPALIWVAETVYERVGPVWRVTLVRRDERGDWRAMRYRYDIPSGTLHFAGDMPAPAELAAAARHSGRLLADA